MFYQSGCLSFLHFAISNALESNHSGPTQCCLIDPICSYLTVLHLYSAVTHAKHSAEIEKLNASFDHYQI